MFFRYQSLWMDQKSVHILFREILQPREKRAREAQGNADDGTSEERPARRTLAFHGKSSPPQKVLCLSLLNEYSQQFSCLHSRKYVVSFKKYTDLDPCFYFCFKASRRILQKAKLVRSPKSPKQLTSPKNKTVVAVTWEKSEEVALVQFIALFGELKKGEWPTFGSKHDYWEKAANFIQETTRKNYKRSSKFFALHFRSCSWLLLISFKYLIHFPHFL